MVHGAPKLRGHLPEFLTTFGYVGPVLRAVAIDVHFRIEPSRVVKSPSLDEPDVRHHGDVREDRRSALVTEVSVDRLTTIAGVVKCLKRPLNRYCGFRYSDQHRKGRPRLLLTVLAMAHRDNGGFSGRRIANLPAETTAGHFTHFLLPQLAFEDSSK